MKMLVSALALAALLTAPAYAQSTDNLMKARELMKVMGVEKTLTEHLSDADNIQRSAAFLITKIAEANPDEESKIGDLIVQDDRTLLPQIIPGYVEYMAEVYATNFTPQELDRLTGFYKSDAMQEVFKKSAESTDVVKFNGDQQAQSNAFLQTPTGKKLQHKSPQIIKQINLYAADVVRTKQRNMLYEALRRDLPKNGLQVPDPFTPDAFMDKTIHDNTVKANTLPEPVAQPPVAPAPVASPAMSTPIVPPASFSQPSSVK